MPLTRRRCRPALALLLALASGVALLPSPRASASFFDIYGFSARAIGRGNAMVALGFDYDAAYYNVANVLGRKRTHIGFGFSLVAPDLDIRTVSGEFASIQPSTEVAMHLGFSTPIGGWFENRLGFGLAFYHPLTTGTNITSFDPNRRYFYRYQDLPDKLIIAAGLAGEPLDWLRLGIGVQILAELDGRVDASLSLAQGRFTHEKIDVNVQPTVAPTAGLALGPIAGFRLGVSYRHALELGYHLPVVVDIEEIGKLDVFVDGVSLYTPSQLSVGLGWDSGLEGEPGVSLELGLTWERWSEAPPFGALFRLGIDLSNVRPTDPQGVPEKLIDVSSAPVPLGAKDTITSRLGIEYRPSTMWAIRGGYTYRPCPLPLPIYEGNAIDAPGHIISLGLGLTIGDPLGDTGTPVHIDLAAQLTRLTQRAVQKDPQFGSPQGAYEAGGMIWHIGLDLRHDYY